MGPFLKKTASATDGGPAMLALVGIRLEAPYMHEMTS